MNGSVIPLTGARPADRPGEAVGIRTGKRSHRPHRPGPGPTPDFGLVGLDAQTQPVQPMLVAVAQRGVHGKLRVGLVMYGLAAIATLAAAYLLLTLP